MLPQKGFACQKLDKSFCASCRYLLLGLILPNTKRTLIDSPLSDLCPKAKVFALSFINHNDTYSMSKPVVSAIIWRRRTVIQWTTNYTTGTLREIWPRRPVEQKISPFQIDDYWIRKRRTGKTAIPNSAIPSRVATLSTTAVCCLRVRLLKI
jgi:hypothetical protein